MARKHYFTPRDVDQLIPKLEAILQHVALCRSRAEALTGQIAGSEGPADDPKEIARRQLLKAQVQFLLEAVQDDVAQVLQLGGVAKDLDQGLIDFPGQMEGEEVWLCWKKGETKVRFWHPLDHGFAQRQALPRPQIPSTFH